MTIRNFIQNHIIGILLAGLVYGTGITIKEIVEQGFEFKELVVIPGGALYLGAFSFVFSLPYFIIMLITIMRNSAPKQVFLVRLKFLQIALSILSMLAVFALSDGLHEGLIMNGLVLGYAITGTLLMFYPIKTIYIKRNNTEK